MAGWRGDGTKTQTLKSKHMHALQAPYHSGRGDGSQGWKLVTGQTKAGGQDWTPLLDKVKTLNPKL
jgi:hypothetical protein